MTEKLHVFDGFDDLKNGIWSAIPLNPASWSIHVLWWLTGLPLDAMFPLEPSINDIKDGALQTAQEMVFKAESTAKAKVIKYFWLCSENFTGSLMTQSSRWPWGKMTPGALYILKQVL